MSVDPDGAVWIWRATERQVQAFARTTTSPTFDTVNPCSIDDIRAGSAIEVGESFDFGALERDNAIGHGAIPGAYFARP